MTIAVSLKVNDGVVLAADSATTLIGQSPDGSVGVVNVYNNAN
jgi:20S proteasome alpha/beta subunit